MPKELSDFIPEKFDLNNFSLSRFFSEIAISLDSHRLGKAKEEDYKQIYHAARILRNKSKDFRTGKEDYPNDNLFFWKFYGKKEEERSVDCSRELSAARLLVLSEKLYTVKDLPKEEIEELTKTCARLSHETMGLDKNLAGLGKY